MKNKYKKNGFTLIELLVVIVIVGILSGIGIAGYNDYKEKAEDAKNTAECAQKNKCELIISTCKKGEGEASTNCDTLCDISMLTASCAASNSAAYPDSSQWTDADCFIPNDGSFSGTILGYDNSCPKEIIIPINIGGIEVKNIGSGVFLRKGLTSARIPNTVNNIGNSSFAYNELSSIIIPSSVQNIDKHAFTDNELTSVVIPNGVKRIDDATFYQNNLTTVFISGSVEFIGSSAFRDNNLSTIVIPASVTNIIGSAFFGNGVNKNSKDIIGFSVDGADQTWNLVGRDWVKQ